MVSLTAENLTSLEDKGTPLNDDKASSTVKETPAPETAETVEEEPATDRTVEETPAAESATTAREETLALDTGRETDKVEEENESRMNGTEEESTGTDIR